MISTGCTGPSGPDKTKTRFSELPWTRTAAWDGPVGGRERRKLAKTSSLVERRGDTYPSRIQFDFAIAAFAGEHRGRIKVRIAASTFNFAEEFPGPLPGPHLALVKAKLSGTKLKPDLSFVHTPKPGESCRQACHDFACRQRFAAGVAIHPQSLAHACHFSADPTGGIGIEIRFSLVAGDHPRRRGGGHRPSMSLIPSLIWRLPIIKSTTWAPIRPGTAACIPPSPGRAIAHRDAAARPSRLPDGGLEELRRAVGAVMTAAPTIEEHP